MNSLMSKRRNSTPRAAASCFATSVFPTPVGPAKRNEPTGLSGRPGPGRAGRRGEDLDPEGGGELLRALGLPDSGRAREEERADRLVGLPEPGAREPDGGDHA